MANYSFRKFQPLSLRLWHWFNAIVILGLLLTVLLRKTLFNWRTNSPLIEEKLKAVGTVITPDLAKEIAIAIRNPLWDWHIYLGFSLGVLWFGRILIGLFVEKRIPGFPVFKKAALHYNFVKSGYAVFIFATLIMVLSGFMLNFKTEIGLSKDFAGTIKEIHELLMWFFVVFIGGHLVGVVIAENGNDPGLVSDMIHGGDRQKK